MRHQRMKRVFLIVLFGLSISSCGFSEDMSSLKVNGDKSKIPVFIQLNVPEDSGQMESYYYYANISEALYHQIKNNQMTSGFLFLKQAKYWGSDNLIHDYKDSENTGDILFRIEDIRRLKRVTKLPEAGQGLEQFDEETPTDPIPRISGS